MVTEHEEELLIGVMGKLKKIMKEWWSLHSSLNKLRSISRQVNFKFFKEKKASHTIYFFTSGLLKPIFPRNIIKTD